MKKLVLMFVALAVVAGGCKYFDKGKNKKKAKQEKVVDPAAAEKAREDSIRIAQEQEAERIRVARQEAIQDSIRQVKEREAQFRFHVIIGSFKVPSNAESWEREVRQMGFKDTKIIDGPNGFTLVSVGSFDTYSKAFNEIDRINYNAEEEEPWELWVYEKLD
ncbi:MAG: SPOR domain-containing protein [Bacteroidales bacterium]|nr:SPOR domain-containing protein [Bacteroidales bacterium]